MLFRISACLHACAMLSPGKHAPRIATYICRLLEASSLIDDVFASTLASRIEPEAAIILADAALACPAAATGAPKKPDLSIASLLLRLPLIRYAD